MAKGGYTGGGSIVSASGWFLRGTISSGRDKEVVTPHEPEVLISADVAPKQVKRKNKVRIPKPLTEDRIEELTVNYLSAVISAHIKCHAPPVPPNEIRFGIQTEIANAGGLIDWAKQHPKFEELMDVKRQSLGLKRKTFAVVKVPGGGLLVTEEGHEADESLALQELIQERSRLERALDDALELTRECRAKIKKLEKQIAIRQLG